MGKVTALASIHRSLGANFTDFGGWEMPLKYGSELAEHRAVRETAGIFDLSHMGEIQISGTQAAAFLDYALVAKYSLLPVSRAKYGLIVNAEGYILDDLITYRLGEDKFLLVPNAANSDAVYAALLERYELFREIDAEVELDIANESAALALIAVQGPTSAAMLVEAGVDAQVMADLRYYSWVEVVLNGIDVLLARTGYTGEDGFELYCLSEHAVLMWNLLANFGDNHGLVPCGLAARDSLRLEAGMPLYGHELTAELTPYDAGMGGMVKLDKDFHYAGDALREHAARAPSRRLVGLSSADRRAARAGALVYQADREVGVITSGQPSPTLGHPIAMAYIDAEVVDSETDASDSNGTAATEFVVKIRDRDYGYQRVELPFYRRTAQELPIAAPAPQAKD